MLDAPVRARGGLIGGPAVARGSAPWQAPRRLTAPTVVSDAHARFGPRILQHDGADRAHHPGQPVWHRAAVPRHCDDRLHVHQGGVTWCLAPTRVTPSIPREGRGRCREWYHDRREAPDPVLRVLHLLVPACRALSRRRGWFCCLCPEPRMDSRSQMATFAFLDPPTSEEQCIEAHRRGSSLSQLRLRDELSGYVAFVVGVAVGFIVAVQVVGGAPAVS